MRSEHGSALFLILIAVALFAALSYAVTQSGRGDGGIEREQVFLDMSQAIQEVSRIRAGVQRMLLTGTNINDIEFCLTADANNMCQYPAESVDFCVTGENCIWAPEGGNMGLPHTVRDLNFQFREAGVSLIDGHGTINIILTIMRPGGVWLTTEECTTMNNILKITTGLLQEVNGGSPFADSLAHSGTWDFCYNPASGAASIEDVLLGWHLLATN